MRTLRQGGKAAWLFLTQSLSVLPVVASRGYKSGRQRKHVPRTYGACLCGGRLKKGLYHSPQVYSVRRGEKKPRRPRGERSARQQNVAHKAYCGAERALKNAETPYSYLSNNSMLIYFETEIYERILSE